MMELTWEDYIVLIIICLAICIQVGIPICFKLYIKMNYDIIILRDNNGNVGRKQYRKKINDTGVVYLVYHFNPITVISCINYICNIFILVYHVDNYSSILRTY